MVKFKDFLRPLSDFSVLFKTIYFSRTFQESPLNSSTFQACANPADVCNRVENCGSRPDGSVREFFNDN